MPPNDAGWPLMMGALSLCSAASAYVLHSHPSSAAFPGKIGRPAPVGALGGGGEQDGRV